MAAIMSPDDYKNRPLAELPQRQGNVQAYAGYDLGDARLADWLRVGADTTSGTVVTEKSSLRNSTFFRAANLISGCIGMLPTNLHRKSPSGIIEKADNHPVHRLLRKRPNGWQTPLQFKSFMQGRALLHGNAFAYKIRRGAEVRELIPLDPRRVRPELTDDWQISYVWSLKDGQTRRLSQDDVFHLRAPFSEDGINGTSLLDVAREALGLAQAADAAAGSLMKNGAYVGGKLKHPKTIGPEAAARLRAQFDDRFTGSENRGRWLLLEEGLDAEPLSMTGKDAEGLGQRKHQAEEVSRFTGVPRPLLMFDETSWGTGIEQLGLFLITYCLMPWFVAWEEVIAQSLLTERERETHYAKFNEGALLRGSLKDQAEFLSKALGGPGATGWMVPDEARELQDRNPIPGGDKPGWGQASTGAPDAPMP